jgi:hypothetical protein
MPLLPIFFGLLVVSAALAYAQHTLASPVLAILGNWVRWALFAFFLATTADYFGSDRPAWLWLATGFLVWPLFETMYSWLAIRALSFSTLPLFPRFMINRTGDAWPNQRRFIALRNWLREEKFAHVQSLTADQPAGPPLRVSVYNDPEGHIRLQLLFTPQPAGNVALCAVFTSITASGARLVTDNVYMPFGGFYPTDWEVERHPWIRSPEALMCRHLRRLAGKPELLQPITDEPITELNQQQQALERTNTEHGILFPRSQHEEYGVLTWEGRYRVWKEAWLLSYFGMPRRY